MPDYLTTCLRSEEATVIAILAAPFNHQFVQTFGDFTKGDLNLNTYAPGGAPREVASVTRAGNKIIVHTQSP
jgi:hypothetical protein